MSGALPYVFRAVKLRNRVARSLPLLREVRQSPDCRHEFEKYAELFAFAVVGIKRCANYRCTSKLLNVLPPAEGSPKPEPFRSAQQLPSSLRLLLVSLDCPYADRLYWRPANYETSVEKVFGCGIGA